jgi:carboxyl-terminal processing protease
VQAAIAGMISGLGESSAGFIRAEDYAAAQESLAGSYQGIGARIAVDHDQVLLFPQENGPAAKAGLQSGDVLLAVGEQSVTGRSVRDLIDKVKGPAGTSVKLTVERAGNSGPLEYHVLRGNVEIPSVDDFRLMPGGIGYISIAEFKGNTGDKVRSTLEALKGANVLGLILDLRSNPGGSVEAARQVVSQFLPPGGLFTYEINRVGQRKEWPVLEGGLAVQGLPMVVLVDEESASITEAVAGALQDAHRALVMGTSTSGKGSTNTLVQLSDGSAIYLPTARWYTPSGRLVEGTGIQPDRWVPFQRESRSLGGERQLNQAYDYLSRLLASSH